jgi:hypothetical protein
VQLGRGGGRRDAQRDGQAGQQTDLSMVGINVDRLMRRIQIDI